jgi:hypothetical protein
MSKAFSALVIAVAIISSCKNMSYDPKLEMPESGKGFSKGHTLTPLGCLVYGPWEYNLRPGQDSLYNVKLFDGDSLLYSKAAKYTPTEANLVFQLDTDFTFQYWTKKDYINSPVDTVNGAIIYHGVPIDNANIKNIYKGSWAVNFKDSTLKLNFDDVRMSYPALDGRYIELGSSILDFQRTTWVDSTISEKNVKLKKVITTYLTHW